MKITLIGFDLTAMRDCIRIGTVLGAAQHSKEDHSSGVVYTFNGPPPNAIDAKRTKTGWTLRACEQGGERG